MAPKSHCYLWVPNALLAEGLQVLENWGFTYKANLVWAKRRKDGGPDGRGVGIACGSYLCGAGLPIYWNKMPQSGVQRSELMRVV